MKYPWAAQRIALAMCLTLNMLPISSPAFSAEVAPAQNSAPRVVNVTPDSAPGWLPTIDMEEQVRKTAMDFLAAMDSGAYEKAYAFLAEIDRRDQSLSTFSDRIRQFNTGAGAVTERRITTVTWTKDPAQAPFPGVYAALDLVSRFTNIDRHCGYLVLYQAPSGGAFQVMREENNFLDNAAAASIAKQSSPAAVEETWAKIYAHCPGYQSSASKPTQPTPIAEAAGSTIGYPTVAAALDGLHSKPGITFTKQDGWTVADDAATMTIWSFAPEGHPAYPSVVKRHVVQQAGGVALEMNVKCESSKSACDDLVRSFEQLNAQMKAGVRGR